MKILKESSTNNTSVVKTRLESIIRKHIKIKKTKDNVSEDTIYIQRDSVEINTFNIINDIADNCNKLVIQTYLFLKTWILKKYENREILSKITEDMIRLIFKLFTFTKVSKKLQHETNHILFSEMQKFYNEEYCKLYNHPKINCSNYAQIFNYLAIDIKTNIENNIQLHFLNYIKCYVNGVFYVDYDDKLSKKENIAIKRNLKQELFKVKEDLIFDTKKSDPKYHEWIDNLKNTIFTKTDKNQPFWSNLTIKPQQYLPHMIYMNRELEDRGRKTFNVLPLRTSYITKYIPIDTQVIIKLLMKDLKGSSKYLNNMSQNADNIWNMFFDLNNKAFKKKNYKFNHLIYTDGFAVSILFIKDACAESKIEKFKNFKKKRLENISLCKNKTSDEIIKYKEEIKNKKILDKEEIKKNKMIKKNEAKEAFKKLSKEEKQELKQQRLNKLDTEEKKLKNQPEFPYLEDLTENQINKLKNSKLVYIDPGKIRLYTMIDDKNKVLKYSNAEYIKRIKRKKYSKKSQKIRDELEITRLEKILSNYNSKSCYLNKFKEYVEIKNQLAFGLLELYKNVFFRKYKWYSYIMKQREIERLTNLIAKTYGKDCKLLMGDWSPSVQMKNFMPTPMIGLKRKLRKKFEIINLDEYNTSKLSYITETETENLRLRIKVAKKDENKKVIRDEKGEVIKELMLKDMHSILTYKMSNGRLGCINRDINSVKNMRKIVHHWFYYGKRLEEYSKSKSTNQSLLEQVDKNEESNVLKVVKKAI